MDSTEDNGDKLFKMLKGITREEALAIHDEEFMNLVREHYPEGYNGVISLPIAELSERVDKRLIPFGWSYKRIVDIGSSDFS